VDELKQKIAEAIAGLTDEQIEQAIEQSPHAGKVDAQTLRAAVGG
jgi:hypothetical protein